MTAPAEIRYHTEAVHRERAQSPLPFRTSHELTALVDRALRTSAAAPAEGPSNPYALQRDTLAFLGALMEINAPRTIAEFGSGASTTFFADWAAARGARLLSVEHDRGWFLDVGSKLSAPALGVTDMRHASLELTRQGLRAFLTYRGLRELAEAAGRSDLVLIDGPHLSGREPVIQSVLESCRPGTAVVIDDFRHYAVREMLLHTRPALAACFAGAPVEQNSHGLFVLRCLTEPVRTPTPTRVDLWEALRSYRRCWRDFRAYGTGA